MINTIDISKLSLEQIVLAFFIVLSVLFAAGTALPKVSSAFKNLWGIVRKTEKRKKQFEQIEKNTKNIESMDAKIDLLTETLNNFFEENQKKNEKILQRIDEMDKERLHDRLDRDRSEILDFANAIRSGQKQSINRYRHMLNIGAKYHTIIKEKNIDNGVFEADYKYILKSYDKGDFLDMEGDDD